MMLCTEQAGRVLMMLFALLIVPLPAVMSEGDGSFALALSSVLFAAAAAALNRSSSVTSRTVFRRAVTNQPTRTGL